MIAAEKRNKTTSIRKHGAPRTHQPKPGCDQAKTGLILQEDVDLATQTVRWLKIFYGMAAGSLTILLTSCTNIKAPKTLFVTFHAERDFFEIDTKQIRTFLNTYTEAFQQSNPDTSIVYISYPSRQFFNQIEEDSNLSLGPDIIITNQFEAKELLSRDLIKTLPNQPYFNSIYSPRLQSIAKTKNGYALAPWLIDTQIACFDKTEIEASPETMEELEALSASGKKIGLASNSFGLIWTAGTQGAISELSSLGSTRSGKATYPAIKKWLRWLQKAARYKNISFHEDARELGTKLKKKELNWTTCWGGQLEDLKKTMGHSLGVAALPNGTTSKALPTFRIYGFSLGKNSSPMQLKMEMKFIKTDVNDIAQRKIQLDDIGVLAANKNVSIPPESSRKLAALNASFNEQSQSYAKEWPGLERYGKQNPHLGRTLVDLINGYLDVNEALTMITKPRME